MISRIVDVLARKGGQMYSVDPRTPVLDAVRVMNRHHVGSVMVHDDDGRLCGMFSERDVLARVIAARRSPEDTQVGEVMSTNVVTLRADASVEDAMRVVTETRCRHLPVVDNERVIGLVSVGDLMEWVTHDLEHEIDTLSCYVFSPYATLRPTLQLSADRESFVRGSDSQTVSRGE